MCLSVVLSISGLSVGARSRSFPLFLCRRQQISSSRNIVTVPKNTGCRQMWKYWRQISSPCRRQASWTCLLQNSVKRTNESRSFASSSEGKNYETSPCHPSTLIYSNVTHCYYIVSTHPLIHSLYERFHLNRRTHQDGTVRLACAPRRGHGALCRIPTTRTLQGHRTGRSHERTLVVPQSCVTL